MTAGMDGMEATEVAVTGAAALREVAALPGSRLHDVHPARIDVEPEEVAAPRVSRGYLGVNVRDRVVLLFLMGACLAQAADAVTTAIALHTRVLVEANPLMRAAVTEPVITGSLKVLVVVLLSLLAMMRLPTRYARLALLLAFGISALAPVQNAFQLLLSR